MIRKHVKLYYMIVSSYGGLLCVFVLSRLLIYNQIGKFLKIPNFRTWIKTDLWIKSADRGSLKVTVVCVWVWLVSSDWYTGNIWIYLDILCIPVSLYCRNTTPYRSILWNNVKFRHMMTITSSFQIILHQYTSWHMYR